MNASARQTLRARISTARRPGGGERRGDAFALFDANVAPARGFARRTGSRILAPRDVASRAAPRLSRCCANGSTSTRSSASNGSTSNASICVLRSSCAAARIVPCSAADVADARDATGNAPSAPTAASAVRVDDRIASAPAFWSVAANAMDRAGVREPNPSTVGAREETFAAERRRGRFDGPSLAATGARASHSTAYVTRGGASADVTIRLEPGPPGPPDVVLVGFERVEVVGAAARISLTTRPRSAARDAPPTRGVRRWLDVCEFAVTSAVSADAANAVARGARSGATNASIPAGTITFGFGTVPSGFVPGADASAAPSCMALSTHAGWTRYPRYSSSTREATVPSDLGVVRSLRGKKNAFGARARAASEAPGSVRGPEESIATRALRCAGDRDPAPPPSDAISTVGDPRSARHSRPTIVSGLVDLAPPDFFFSPEDEGSGSTMGTGTEHSSNATSADVATSTGSA